MLLFCNVQLPNIKLEQLLFRLFDPNLQCGAFRLILLWLIISLWVIQLLFLFDFFKSILLSIDIIFERFHCVLKEVHFFLSLLI